MKKIIHITSLKFFDSQKDGEYYRSESFTEEGFIHFCEPQQLKKVLSRHFTGKDNLIALEFDANKIEVEVIYEDLYQQGETFPHVYGPINLSALISVKSI
tara:strand:- start:267 stop:566 length:300 start_codon:yes stop_codon:yes gene_type:complete